MFRGFQVSLRAWGLEDFIADAALAWVRESTAVPSTSVISSGAIGGPEEVQDGAAIDDGATCRWVCVPPGNAALPGAGMTDAGTWAAVPDELLMG